MAHEVFFIAFLMKESTLLQNELYNNTKLTMPKYVKSLILIIAIGIISVITYFKEHSCYPATAPGNVRVAFDSECESLLVSEINTATNEIVTAIYSFTGSRIANALINASRRNVKILLKYDQKQKEWEGMEKAIKRLESAHIKCVPVVMRGERDAMHHKFMVIDKRKVLTGSFNFTVNASKYNYENINVIDSADIARAYTEEFERICDK